MDEAPPPATPRRHHCPIGSCGWAHDEPPLVAPAGMTDYEAMMIPMIHQGRVETIIHEHYATHSPAEWAAEVKQLRGELEAARINIERIPGADDWPA